MNTLDGILDFLREAVENKIPVSPGQWLDAAQKLVALQQGLDEELIEAEMKLNEARATLILEHGPGTGKELAKATGVYKDWLLLDKKSKRVIETVRIAKKRAEVNY